MHKMHPSEPLSFQADRSEHLGIEPATKHDQPEGSVVSTGLCSTCNNLPTCTLRRSDKHPVMFCEEFDGVVRAATPVAMTERTSLAVKGQGFRESEHSSKHLGLCRTCEHRESCTFPRSEGGVWQCEEFV